MGSSVVCHTGLTSTVPGFCLSRDIHCTFYCQNAKISPDSKSLKSPLGGSEPVTTRAKTLQCASVPDAVQVSACVTVVSLLWAADVVDRDGTERKAEKSSTVSKPS